MAAAYQPPDLDVLRERAEAALGGEYSRTGVSEMTPILRVGLGRIESWTPRFDSNCGVRFFLDSPTGVAFDIEGRGSWRARWRPDDSAHSALTLHTDGVSSYLLEEDAPQGFLYQLTEDDRRRLVGMQPTVDEWLERGTSIGNGDIIFAAFLDERQAWMSLAIDRVKHGIDAAFSAKIEAAEHRPIRLLGAVMEYLAAAYVRLEERQRATFHVLIDDGLPVMAAIDAAGEL